MDVLSLLCSRVSQTMSIPCMTRQLHRCAGPKSRAQPRRAAGSHPTPTQRSLLHQKGACVLFLSYLVACPLSRLPSRQASTPAFHHYSSCVCIICSPNGVGSRQGCSLISRATSSASMSATAPCTPLAFPGKTSRLSGVLRMPALQTVNSSSAVRRRTRSSPASPPLPPCTWVNGTPPPLPNQSPRPSSTPSSSYRLLSRHPSQRHSPPR